MKRIILTSSRYWPSRCRRRLCPEHPQHHGPRPHAAAGAGPDQQQPAEPGQPDPGSRPRPTSPSGARHGRGHGDRERPAERHDRHDPPRPSRAPAWTLTSTPADRAEGPSTWT